MNELASRSMSAVVAPSRFWGLICGFGLVFVPGNLWAQSISTVVGGLSASPTRASPASVFWNPATIGRTNGTQIETNISFVGGWLIYDRDGTDPNTGNSYQSSEMSMQAPNPFISIVSPLGTRDFRFGYATYLPGGTSADFPEDGAQRYSLINGYVIPWHHQLTFAFRPHPAVSIAIAGIASLSFFSSTVDYDLGTFMENVLKLESISKENPAFSTRVEVESSMAPSFGGIVGIHFSPSYQWNFGLAFVSPIVYSFEGNLYLKTPSLAPLDTAFHAVGFAGSVPNHYEAETNLPAVLNLGLSYQPLGFWTAEIFGRYVFSSFTRSVSITVDKSTIPAARTEVATGKQPDDCYTLGTIQTLSLWRHWRFGMNTSYSSLSVPSHLLSTTFADFDTLIVGGFLNYEWSSHVLFGVEYAHSFMFDRQAENTSSGAEPNDRFALGNSDGQFRAGLDRLGVSLKYVF